VPPTVSTQTGLSICTKKATLGSSSIWRRDGPHTSNCGSGTRSDGAYSCADQQGNVDSTSIFMDLGSVSNKVGCFIWRSSSTCNFPMKSIARIEFDAEWTGCDNLWMAPLWTFSDPWQAPQGTSGEIDFIEECTVPKVTTNLGCYSVNDAGCQDGDPWGGTSGTSSGPKHLSMTLDTSGNLAVQVCNLDRSGCRQVAKYDGYLGKSYPTSGGRNNAFHFVSDIFNDPPGDASGGWDGCQASRNTNTQCKYAITNLKLTSTSGRPVFSPGSCAALNA